MRACLAAREEIGELAGRGVSALHCLAASPAVSAGAGEYGMTDARLRLVEDSARPCRRDSARQPYLTGRRPHGMTMTASSTTIHSTARLTTPSGSDQFPTSPVSPGTGTLLVSR